MKNGSRWVAKIVIPFHQIHAFEAFREQMTSATLRMYSSAFGHATGVRIDRELLPREDKTVLHVTCLTDGHPAEDPLFRKIKMAEIAGFFGKSLRHYGAVDVEVNVFADDGR